MQIIHGDILFTPAKDKMEVYEDSYIVVENGKVSGIFRQIPEALKSLPVTDHGRGLIIPAFSDLHVHASQYIQRGMGMDLLLSDWLNTYTFPQEANFASVEYAQPIYQAFADSLVLHGTFHANVFTTIHRASAGILIREMEKRGLTGLVGKVNMDYASPSYLCETTEESIRETELFLEEHSKNRLVRPILTPRFVPTCSRELLTGLGKLARKYNTGLHTHVVESIWEAGEAVRLFPDCSCDTEIYEKCGLLGYGPAIFAHFIFPSPRDIQLAKAYHAVTVHCPEATANVIAGIMPAARLMEDDISIAVGSDIGAAGSPAIYRQIAHAIRLSKLKAFYEPDSNRALTLTEAFYMATKAGGSVFGKYGSFENGYDFHAIVIDRLEDEGHPLRPEQRLERFCYTGDDRNITARYL